MIGAGDLTVTQLIPADHAPSKYPPGPSCMNRRAISFCFPWIMFQISWYYFLLHCAAVWKKSAFSTSSVSFSVSVHLSLSHTHAWSESSPGPDIWTWSANPDVFIGRGHTWALCRSEARLGITRIQLWWFFPWLPAIQVVWGLHSSTACRVN